MYKLRCDYCESKNITKNIQECYVEYDYNTKTQEYSNEPTLINEPIDNKHLCDKCYHKWCNGDLF
jgi:hypothetical protein